jgi:putative transposase
MVSALTIGMNRRSAYPTDLTDRQWELLAPLLPAPAATGHPREHDLREVVNALLYMTHTGCQWRFVPHDFPPWSVVRYYCDQWTVDGTLERIHTALHHQVRLKAGRNAQPSAGIVDSQRVKTGRQPGVRGYDGGKQLTGRKRHLLVDTQGWLLAVLVTAARVSDPAGAQQVFQRAHPHCPRLRHLWADSAYQGGLVEWAQAAYGWVIEIVTHLVPVHTFVVQPWRWIVERTFGWWTEARLLIKDYEVKPTTSESWILLAMCQLMLRRAAPVPKRQRAHRPRDCDNLS